MSKFAEKVRSLPYTASNIGCVEFINDYAERIAWLVDAAEKVIDLDFRGPSSDKLRKAFAALEDESCTKNL
jgi:hypothetical protein